MTARSPAIFDSLVDRTQLPFFAIERGYSHIIEIGTYRGEFAAHILTHFPGTVTTIDPWIEQDDATYRDGCLNGGGGEKVSMEEHMQVAMERLRPWLQQGRCRAIRALSVDVAAVMANDSVDCVYCDGNHSYEAVAADIEAFWPKIRTGGVLGGHDAYTRNDVFQRADAFNAIIDFAEKTGVRPRVTPDTSWWFLKP